VDNEQVNDTPATAAPEAAGGKKKKGIGVNFKVSAKGAVSVYGLGRFPVTLYREQWLRLLEKVDDLKVFLDDHAGELKGKGEAEAEASTSEAAVEAATAPEATTPSGGAEGGEAQATTEAVREAAPEPSAEAGSEAKAATDAGNPE
jgi:hypothetical protein